MTPQKLTLKITNMSCASCAINNEKALLKTNGIINANVNFATKKAYVEYDADILNENKVRQIIIDNGYQVETSNFQLLTSNDDQAHHTKHDHMAKMNLTDGGHEHGGEDTNKTWRAFLWSAVLSLPLIIGMFVKIKSSTIFLDLDLIMWVHLILATIVVFYFGWRFHRMALMQARKFHANMDTLISMGTAVAYFYSLWAVFSGQETYFESAALIITLILLGKYFEARSTGQAGEAMKKLMELGAKKARCVINGAEEEVDIENLKIGDILLIKPSEKIPLDGEVIEGESNVDESMLTGESMPIDKKSGNPVFGATINQDGVLKIRVTRTGEGTVLAQIIRTVEEAQGSKAPIQKLADKVSSIFVPTVIVLAIFTFAGWFLYAHNFSAALIKAVAVLVIACPCALGLATPTAIMAGTGKGAKNGILFKTRESFERAKNITMAVFDKTGTLTKGKAKVQKIITAPQTEFNENQIVKIAASLARNSEHPLSKAVALYATEQKIQFIESSDIKETKGEGISGIYSEHKSPVLLGNIKLLANNHLDTSWAEKLLASDEAKSGPILFIGQNSRVEGAILVVDEIREEAEQAINELKQLGLKAAMITGDHRAAAESVAKKLGINNVLAEVLPDEKANEIKNLQNKGEKIIFVGDGINDAPSLVQADLGIAMGSATDIAREAGQIILTQNNLEKVIQAIKISKQTFKTIRQNLFWAFFYNIIAIPLAMAGLLNPIIAAGAMAFSSVSVVLNSLRIYKK
jgi:Cu+-exporting ATPase